MTCAGFIVDSAFARAAYPSLSMKDSMRVGSISPQLRSTTFTWSL